MQMAKIAEWAAGWLIILAWDLGVWGRAAWHTRVVREDIRGQANGG